MRGLGLKASSCVLAALLSVPATAATVNFASSHQDYSIRAINFGNAYVASSEGSTSLFIDTVLTSDTIDAAVTTGNANGTIRFDHSYVANENGGYFGFDRSIHLNLGPFIDPENDYDTLQADIGLNPYDAEFTATEIGILRVSWSFLNAGLGTGLSLYLDTPGMSYNFNDGAGSMNIVVATGNTISVRGENSWSASAPYSGTTNGFFDFKFRQLSDNTVPEPASWAMMIVGFTLVGAAMRRTGRRLGPAMARSG